jgi:uncharacterized membrane protein YidH (DUF202 family)
VSAPSRSAVLCDGSYLKEFWTDTVMPPIALERTFLGHLRTSLALASCSVVISQCFSLSLGASDTMAVDEVRFRRIGKPLSCALLLWAMITAILGAIRFLRMQDALVREDAVIDGGWELHAEGIGLFVVCRTYSKTESTDNGAVQ